MTSRCRTPPITDDEIIVANRTVVIPQKRISRTALIDGISRKINRRRSVGGSSSASTTSTMTAPNSTMSQQKQSTSRSRARMIFRTMSPMSTTSSTKTYDDDSVSISSATTASIKSEPPPRQRQPQRQQQQQQQQQQQHPQRSGGISPPPPPPDTTTTRRSRSLKENSPSSLHAKILRALPSRSPSPHSRQRSISPHSRILRRARSRSRSRSGDYHDLKPSLVAVTSCRSDAYHHQKAPGSTSRLPRKAPSALKLFHELATGVKDAYEAVGAKPDPPKVENGMIVVEEGEEGNVVLWEFMGNLDFLLKLVDEVAVDTATRGALKDDTTFKCLRDVIKKCNKVLEAMLVRRERKYTLFFQLVQPYDKKEIEKIKNWNVKVEKAVGGVVENRKKNADASDTESVSSIGSESTSDSLRSGGVKHSKEPKTPFRGRSMLPTAGRVRGRRATPTPRLRRKHEHDSSDGESSSAAAEDGFSAVTTPGAEANLLQPVIPAPTGPSSFHPIITPAPLKDGQAKEELVEVIRGLRVEKQMSRLKGERAGSPSELKPNWHPKAKVPDVVPKLPGEYIHRHRLMKQVVNCLLDRGPKDTDTETPITTYITSITSRHADKAGNGKTTLAVASIQTIDVRERFPDGIIWLKLGREPLTESKIKDLYEEIYRQLSPESSSSDDNNTETTSNDNDSDSDKETEDNDKKKTTKKKSSPPSTTASTSLVRSCGAELDGLKSSLSTHLTSQKILLCLDDVWSIEDAQYFLFPKPENSSFRILLTTRQPSLLGSNAREIFVRIFSEHEAVKLLLSSAGRRPFVAKRSRVFADAKVIAKGCGNSPLAIRLAGGMLRRHCSFTLRSPTWTQLIANSRLALEEATKMRSFSKSVGQILELTFRTIDDEVVRMALKRCFMTFAVVFSDNEWLDYGRGIEKEVILSLFGALEEMDKAVMYLEILDRMNLLEKTSSRKSKTGDDEGAVVTRYTMHDSIKVIGRDMAAQCAKPRESGDDEQPSNFLGSTIQNVSKYLSSSLSNSTDEADANVDHDEDYQQYEEHRMHQMMVAALTGGWRPSKSNTTRVTSVWKQRGGIEDYIINFLPQHLIQSRAYSHTGDLLVDKRFISKRVNCLGCANATRRHVLDLIDLRKESSNNAKQSSSDNNNASTDTDDNHDTRPHRDFNLGNTLRDASRRLVDEVYRVDTSNSSSTLSLDMALCLSGVGDGLLKCRQPRDAMLRLEEAVGIYRGLLGAGHVDVARALSCVAKAYVKIGESRVALLKFGEAATIYDGVRQSETTWRYDAMMNVQNVATLLVDLGNYAKAEGKYVELVRARESVHGMESYEVARTINDYAAVLAKNGKTEEALRQYEMARGRFKSTTAKLAQQGSLMLMDDRFDIVMIDLNVASIKAKKGDFGGAITSYENVVRVLRKTESQMNAESNGTQKDFSLSKHLIVAMGRIGSLKLKQGDAKGSLKAFEEILNEMKDDSPTFIKVEVSRAHIKCATIYRQDPCGSKQAISHLRKALKMYKQLYGKEHRDTQALESSLAQWLQEEGGMSDDDGGASKENGAANWM